MAKQEIDKVKAAFEYHKCSQLFQTSDQELFLTENAAKNWIAECKLEDKTILTLKNS